MKQLHLGGESVSFEELGPIIINADGTTRRIANWVNLTKSEQESSWRLISARNKRRLQALQEQQQQNAAASTDTDATSAAAATTTATTVEEPTPTPPSAPVHASS